MISISIIVATYNAGATLENCLQSIIPQLNDQIELIIIDGKSTDNTLDIVNEKQQYITFFLSEPDKGIYDAWNKGIMHAKGEWIMFIGADDTLLPNAIRTYLDYLRNLEDSHTYDYICAHNEYVNEKNKVIKIIGKEPSWGNMKRYMAAAHVASLHNRQNLFETIGKYEITYHICADYELLLRKRDALKYSFLPDCIARMKAGGMSMSLQALIETFKIRDKYHTINHILNRLLLLKSIICYKFYCLHK